MNKSYASTLSSSAVSKLTPRTSKKRKRQTATGDERAKEQHHQVQVEKKHNSNTNRSSSSSSSKKRNVAKPLNGIILSVSTLDVKDKKHSSTDSSFSAVSALCLELGAKVSSKQQAAYEDAPKQNLLFTGTCTFLVNLLSSSQNSNLSS